MASFIYDSAREAFLKADIDYATAIINAVLVRSAYTPSQAAHSAISDLGAHDLLADCVTLASKTTTDGVADAANVVFTAIAAGDEIGYIVIYVHDAGTPENGVLICCIDEEATGLPVTPNGGDITCAWHASGIFKL